MWNQQQHKNSISNKNSEKIRKIDQNTNRATNISNQAHQLYNFSGLWVTVPDNQQHFRKIIKNLATFPKNS
jgi:hypothetical protein